MLVFIYAALAYLVFLGTFVYAVFFLVGPVDSGPAGPWWLALAVDLALLALFAVQHTVMARGAFKRWLTRFIPASAERTTFVLAASLSLILLFWQWRPLPDVVWSVSDQPWPAIILALYAAGWLLVLASTYMINHFDLFGLRQAYLALRGHPCTPLPFVNRYAYAWIRHPIMSGFFVAFWATPRMTAGHLLFAAASSGYILVGVWFEERDLRRHLGEVYEEYRHQVPAFLPWPGRRAGAGVNWERGTGAPKPETGISR